MKTTPDQATARPWRVSIKGNNQILNAAGNPLTGQEQEILVKQGNEHAALVAVAKAAEEVLNRAQGRTVLGGSNLKTALAALAAIQEGKV